MSHLFPTPDSREHFARPSVGASHAPHAPRCGGCAASPCVSGGYVSYFVIVLRGGQVVSVRVCASPRQRHATRARHAPVARPSFVRALHTSVRSIPQSISRKRFKIFVRPSVSCNKGTPLRTTPTSRNTRVHDRKSVHREAPASRSPEDFDIPHCRHKSACTRQGLAPYHISR